ncbi:hypothetical protein KAW43_01160 [Candidatus Parcubacteria bacterium]|jgi:hypothetical protein|nr:hypothetical protein [Candidatus Parcubacteria bacterium]
MEPKDIISYIESFEPQVIFAQVAQTEMPLVMQQILGIAKPIFWAFSLFLILWLVFLIAKTDWLRLRYVENIVQFLTFKPYGVKRLTKQWDRIFKKIDTGRETEYKLAVIEADSLLDEMLKKSGYSGKTFEEKVKNLSPMIFKDKEQLLKAHKNRNYIIADPDFKLEAEQTKKILETYRSVLISLGLL